jgi:peptidoglycan/LPS O-acetylase OafA/YrhL
MYLARESCTLVGVRTGETWRLGHRPALDGLRGVAVLLVIAYHGCLLVWGAAAGAPALGTVGVGMFFTLSGFLITSLLLEEFDGTRRVNLRAFFGRRARRLLPAVTALVVVVLAASLFVPDFASPHSAAATMLYAQNWLGALGGDGGALGHTWSLAIEEQFYLVWPLLFIGLMRFGRRAVFVVALLGSVLSFLWRDALFGHVSSWRIYAGTDTRADGLLIGCALAVVVPLLARHWAWRVAGWVGALMLFATVTTKGHFNYDVMAPLRTSLGTALMIAAVVLGGRWRILKSAALRWVGRRSYGLYLWHVPVVLLLYRINLPAAVLLVIYVGAASALTVASWRLIERPFLRPSADLVHRELWREVPRRRDVQAAAAGVVGN